MGPVLKGILLIVVVLLAVGAYFLLQQSQSDESDIDFLESQEF
jgi:hypothetical protein